MDTLGEREGGNARGAQRHHSVDRGSHLLHSARGGSSSVEGGPVDPQESGSQEREYIRLLVAASMICLMFRQFAIFVVLGEHLGHSETEVGSKQVHEDGSTHVERLESANAQKFSVEGLEHSLQDGHDSYLCRGYLANHCSKRDQYCCRGEVALQKSVNVHEYLMEASLAAFQGLISCVAKHREELDVDHGPGDADHGHQEGQTYCREIEVLHKAHQITEAYYAHYGHVKIEHLHYVLGFAERFGVLSNGRKKYKYGYHKY